MIRIFIFQYISTLIAAYIKPTFGFLLDLQQLKQKTCSFKSPVEMDVPSGQTIITVATTVQGYLSG